MTRAKSTPRQPTAGKRKRPKVEDLDSDVEAPVPIPAVNRGMGDVTVDQNGDLVLKFGAAVKASVRVSSSVMTLASQKLKEMLAAQVNSAPIPAGAIPMELQLPGDDPAAMATVCKILHFQYSQHPQADAIELDLLRNLAEICSKYKCAGPVSLVTNPWLLPLTSKVAEPGMHDVLAISYLLDDVACFKAASKTLVLEYTEPFESLNISLPFADSALVERALENSRSRTQRAVSLGVEEAFITNFLEKTNTCGAGNTTMGHLCAHNALVLGATIDELYQKQVYPPVWKAKKVRDVLAALRAFKEVNIINKFSHGTMKIGVCTGSTIKAEPKIQAIANQVEKAARGLCLDCVRKGSTQATGCRIPHD